MSYLVLFPKNPEELYQEGGFDKERLHITLFHYPWDNRKKQKVVSNITHFCTEYFSLVGKELSLNITDIDKFGKGNEFIVAKLSGEWINNLRDTMEILLRKNKIQFSEEYSFVPHVTLGKNLEIEKINTPKKIPVKSIGFCNRSGILEEIIF